MGEDEGGGGQNQFGPDLVPPSPSMKQRHFVRTEERLAKKTLHHLPSFRTP
jgi:hypothetical protein